jgi:hypothetical protein
MKKLLIILLMGFICVFISNPGYSQVKSTKKIIKKERQKRQGKPLMKDGKTTRPNKHLSTPKIHKGSASLVFFYYGDSKFITFFQESMELFRAMKNYKKVVLLKEENPHGLTVSQTAINKADIVALPTKDNIIKYIKELTSEGYFIDVWILSHGSPSGFRVFDSTKPNNNGYFYDNDIRSLTESTGFTFIPIRMVYQVNCFGYDLIDDWRAIGAKTALGARQVSFYPYEFSRFAYQWNHEKTFRVARDKAEKNTPPDPVYTYISIYTAHKEKKDGNWSGCPTGYNVLGTTQKALECGKEFFTTKRIWAGETLLWKGNGKSTMDYSNFKIVAGNYDLRKSTVPTWK